MTRVSFYIFSPERSDQDSFICRLLERIYDDGKRAYVHQPDATARQQLDGALWTFRQGSFLPHDLAETDRDSAIVLGGGAPLPERREVLLNLEFPAAIPPDFFSSFERTLEFVVGDEAQRAIARQRYSFYRDRGYPLETFNIA